MVKTKSRQFELPRFLEIQIENNLKELGFSLFEPKKVAPCVQKMSDFYITHPEAQTPWNELWAVVAQLAYYLPLNFLRSQAVIQEGSAREFFKGLRSFTEIGSGLGALTAGLNEIFREGSCVEISATAKEIHQKIFPTKVKYIRSENLNGDLLAMSYALTEIQNIEKFLNHFRALLIIEPSTTQDGRRLMQLRQKLIDKGFYILAPCTHQEECPLLKESKKDWCHDRIHLNMPSWFLDLEKELPFRNKTVTFSYLLARKDQSPLLELGMMRVVGDLLEEKGKSRIMVCRRDHREFLSWLHRDHLDIQLHRGDLLNLDFPIEIKGNEMRIKK